MDESDFQRNCNELVDREVYMNVSWLLRTIMAVRYETEDLDALDLPIDRDDVQRAFDVLESAVVEVPEPLHDKYGTRLTLGRDTLEEQCDELQEQYDSYDNEYNEIESQIAALEDGNPEAAAVLQARQDEVASLGEAYGELLNSIDGAEWEEREVYGVWIVSSWFANRLRDQGEAVIDAGYAGQFWLRCTTGQAISMDASVRTIARELYASDLSIN